MGAVFATVKDVLVAPLGPLGVTEWFEVDQERIDQFAAATGDDQWIHVDPERAKDGPFGATIAHGYLTMALVNKDLPALFRIEQLGMGVNYGVNKVRFPAPVPVGSRLRASGALTEVTEVAGGVQTVITVTMEIEGSERPGCVVETVSRFYPPEDS